MEQTQKLTLQQRLALFDFEKHGVELFVHKPVGVELPKSAVDTLLTEKEKGLDE